MDTFGGLRTHHPPTTLPHSLPILEELSPPRDLTDRQTPLARESTSGNTRGASLSSPLYTCRHPYGVFVFANRRFEPARRTDPLAPPESAPFLSKVQATHRYDYGPPQRPWRRPRPTPRTSARTTRQADIRRRSAIYPDGQSGRRPVGNRQGM